MSSGFSFTTTTILSKEWNVQQAILKTKGEKKFRFSSLGYEYLVCGIRADKVSSG